MMNNAKLFSVGQHKGLIGKSVMGRLLTSLLTGSFAALFSLVVASQINAEQLPNHSWQWNLLKAKFFDSEIAIIKDQKKIAQYHFDCDLSEYKNKEESTPSIDQVITGKYSQSLLIVTCPVGAHSVQLSIFDPDKNTKDAVYSKTGSYLAYWEMEAEQLWIIYDERCESSKTKLCEVPFEQVRIAWNKK